MTPCKVITSLPISLLLDLDPPFTRFLLAIEEGQKAFTHQHAHVMHVRSPSHLWFPSEHGNGNLSSISPTSCGDQSSVSCDVFFFHSPSEKSPSGVGIVSCGYSLCSLCSGRQNNRSLLFLPSSSAVSFHPEIASS